jgi:hypothetical protein
MSGQQSKPRENEMNITHNNKTYHVTPFGTVTIQFTKRTRHGTARVRRVINRTGPTGIAVLQKQKSIQELTLRLEEYLADAA